MPLIISYNPPSYALDSHGSEEFHREYVQPLGRARKNVKVVSHAVIIEANPPGMLSLSANLLATALAASIEKWKLEPLEELNPPGGWYGDLEPTSSILSVERVGPALQSSDTFRYEAPPFRKDHLFPMDKGSRIELTTERSVSRVAVVMRATAPALLSLAKHSIYFSQAPEGARLVYGKPEGIMSKGQELVLERTAFSQDVPWATTPHSRGH